jgi:deazaflavin-dependent oxidoreductase (nitroreductase family)
MPESIEARFSQELYVYVTTTGRRSGQPHEVELWFLARGNTLYCLNSGDGRRAAGMADWILNLRELPRARVRLGADTFDATARFPEPGSSEDIEVRPVTFAKYQPTTGSDLTRWRDTGFLVALDLQA